MLIFGGSGMLGSRIFSTFSGKYIIDSPSSSELNLYDKKAVEKKINKGNYSHIIYSAGLTSQEKAEENRSEALYLNYDVVKLISLCAKKKDIPLIYFSTDAVFDGKDATRPSKEESPRKPVNYYGYTKAKGEDAALNGSESNLVVRLISIYSDFYLKKQDFVRRLVWEVEKGNNCIGVTDLIFNPTFIDSAVDAVEKLVKKKEKGIIHIGASDYMSNFDFSYMLLQKLGFSGDHLEPMSFSKFSTRMKAKRGQYTWLDVSKAKELLGACILSNEESINRFTKLYK